MGPKTDSKRRTCSKRSKSLCFAKENNLWTTVGKMVSNMVKTGIVASVGVAVIILSSTLGWILVPDIATKVFEFANYFYLRYSIQHLNLISSTWNTILQQAIITADNEALYEVWRSPPVPFFIQFFLFNCTNCEDPTDNSVVYNLTQLGPFTFR